MTDAEIRGRLLEHFYGLRDANGGWVPTDEIILSPHPVSRPAIANACQHLAEAKYIQWEPVSRSVEGHTIGRGRITGTGIDVATGAREPTIDIRLPGTKARLLVPQPPSGSAPEVASAPKNKLLPLKPVVFSMRWFDLNRLSAIAGIVGAIVGVIGLWLAIFPRPAPKPPLPSPPPSAGTTWGICVAENGCPWPSSPGFQTRWIGCGSQDEEAKKLCAYDDGTGKLVVGPHSIPSAIGGPIASGTAWNGVHCNSTCGCALYTFTCMP